MLIDLALPVRGTGGAIDLDALVNYFKANEPAGIAVPALTRIIAKP
jgi:hypothetical protein